MDKFRENNLKKNENDGNTIKNRDAITSVAKCVSSRTLLMFQDTHSGKKQTNRNDGAKEEKQNKNGRLLQTQTAEKEPRQQTDPHHLGDFNVYDLPLKRARKSSESLKSPR